MFRMGIDYVINTDIISCSTYPKSTLNWDNPFKFTLAHLNVSLVSTDVNK